MDNFLHELGQLTREQDQIQLLRKITEKSTVNDLRMFIRLVQKDLVTTKDYDFVLHFVHFYFHIENQFRSKTNYRQSWWKCL